MGEGDYAPMIYLLPRGQFKQDRLCECPDGINNTWMLQLAPSSGGVHAG